MFSCVNNKVKIRSQRFYSKMVTTKSDEMRRDLYSIIELLKDELVTVSFTSDLWTSVNSDPYISLTMHFISGGWNLYRFCPYEKPFPERHTGFNIQLCLDSMIEHLRLDNPTMELFFINDNASNMKLAIKKSNYLTQYLCDIHTLELVIKDAIKNTPGMADILKKTKSIAKFVTKSPSLVLPGLQDACKRNNIKFKKPINPPNTRWHGYYQNLSSIFYLQKPLNDLFLSNDNWSEYSLSYSEWKLIDTSSKLLSHFCFTVKIFESEQVPTIHRVIERIYTLNEYLIEFIKKNLNNNIGTKFANELQLGLSRRFPKQGSQNKYRRIANYLAPQYY